MSTPEKPQFEPNAGPGNEPIIPPALQSEAAIVEMPIRDENVNLNSIRASLASEEGLAPTIGIEPAQETGNNGSSNISDRRLSRRQMLGMGLAAGVAFAVTPTEQILQTLADTVPHEGEKSTAKPAWKKVWQRAFGSKKRGIANASEILVDEETYPDDVENTPFGLPSSDMLKSPITPQLRQETDEDGGELDESGSPLISAGGELLDTNDVDVKQRSSETIVSNGAFKGFYKENAHAGGLGGWRVEGDNLIMWERSPSKQTVTLAKRDEVEEGDFDVTVRVRSNNNVFAGLGLFDGKNEGVRIGVKNGIAYFQRGYLKDGSSDRFGAVGIGLPEAPVPVISDEYELRLARVTGSSGVYFQGEVWGVINGQRNGRSWRAVDRQDRKFTTPGVSQINPEGSIGLQITREENDDAEVLFNKLQSAKMPRFGPLSPMIK